MNRRAARRVLAIACLAPVTATADDETEINAPLPNRSYVRFEPSYLRGDGTSTAELESRGIVVYRGGWLPGVDAERLMSGLAVDWTLDRTVDARGAKMGLGDLGLTEVTGVELSWGAAGGGLAMSAPTATESAFGRGRFQLGPAGFVQVTALPALTLSVLVEDYFAPAAASTGVEALRTRIEPGFVVTFPHDWLLSSDGEIDLDWLAHDYTVPVNVEIGCTLGSHVTVQAGPEVEVIGAQRGALKLDVRIDLIDP